MTCKMTPVISVAWCVALHLTEPIVKAFKNDGMNNVMKWVQISDTHLLDSPSDLIKGVNPYQRLSQLLDYVNRNDYDLLILSGDLSDTGSLNSYQQLQNLLKPVSLPILMFAGNHDDAENLNAVFFHQTGYWLAPKESMTLQNWQWLYLDTVLPGEKYGFT